MSTRKEEATALRDSGYSYQMIQEVLGIPRSTLSNWFSERPFTPNREVLRRVQYGPINAAKQKRDQKAESVTRARQLGVEQIGKLSKRDLWMVGIGLYLGEGAKSIESVRIANSDPEIIRLAVKWFKDICEIKDENIIIHLHIYPDNDEEKSMNYWSIISGLPKENFRKTQLDIRTNKLRIRRKTLPYGTAHLRVRAGGDSTKGVELFRLIMGWIEGIQKQI